MALNIYNRKRNFKETPEPKGQKAKVQKGELRFVVQLHSATRLHYDFRLEFDGVFKSWAVPKGPSLNPQDQRLAVFVEDHPIKYGSFEGNIPKGNYGAGTVMVWDEGTYIERGLVEIKHTRKQNEAAVRKGFEKGHMTFVLSGEKLKGEFALIKLKKDKQDKAWLLVKKRDAHSTYKRNQKFIDVSVKTSRTMEEIKLASEVNGTVWLPKREQKAEKIVKPKIARASPMPRKNKPMIATVSRAVVEGEDWIFEPSLGGLRALAEVEGKRVSLYSRSGLAFEKKFPLIVEALKKLDHHAVLDGEIVGRGTKALYHIFDILFFDGRDLRSVSLHERKEILHKNFKFKDPLRIAEPKKTLGALVAKNAKSFYKSGTSKDWLIVENAKASKTNAQPSQPGDLRLTNLEKIYFPEDKITKGDLLNYYKSISSYILPYLKDRPESLNRHPNGIDAAGFYQKDMTGHIPKFLKTQRIFSPSADKTIDYVLCQNEESLLYLVNLGCIEINPWFSRVSKLENPDFFVIDLDPDENSFDHVIEIAQEVHEILETVGAPSFCKTSGATGIHIGIPSGARYTFDEVRAFAEAVCRIIAKKFPATTSVDRNPQKRKKKIYLDYMQNRRGQTLAAPFCVRPRPGAPVSMPLHWKDLRSGLRPGDFNLMNALKIIEKKSDVWKGVLGAPLDLDQCTKLLERKFR